MCNERLFTCDLFIAILHFNKTVLLRDRKTKKKFGQKKFWEPHSPTPPPGSDTGEKNSGKKMEFFLFRNPPTGSDIGEKFLEIFFFRTLPPQKNNIGQIIRK